MSDAPYPTVRQPINMHEHTKIKIILLGFFFFSFLFTVFINIPLVVVSLFSLRTGSYVCPTESNTSHSPSQTSFVSPETHAHKQTNNSKLRNETEN